jgi:hypothetical protein
VEKLDGSCLIVSKYNNELIARTRRGLAIFLKNGEEIEKVLKPKYPKAFNNDLINSEEVSLIYEWVTPTNKIVLTYPEPDIKLTGAIRHKDYSYYKQQELDVIAKDIGVTRPKVFSFNNVESLRETIKTLKNAEGVCVYYGDEQHICKEKSSWYNVIHAFKSNLTLKNIVYLYIEHGLPDYTKFSEIVLNQYTYEGLQEAKSLISLICDAKKNADKIIAGMYKFVAALTGSRKEKAEKIISSYGHTDRASFVFAIMDGKELTDKNWEKLLFQMLCVK